MKGKSTIKAMRRIAASMAAANGAAPDIGIYEFDGDGQIVNLQK